MEETFISLPLPLSSWFYFSREFPALQTDTKSRHTAYTDSALLYRNSVLLGMAQKYTRGNNIIEPDIPMRANTICNCKHAAPWWSNTDWHEGQLVSNDMDQTRSEVDQTWKQGKIKPIRFHSRSVCVCWLSDTLAGGLTSINYMQENIKVNDKLRESRERQEFI